MPLKDVIFWGLYVIVGEKESSYNRLAKHGRRAASRVKRGFEKEIENLLKLKASPTEIEEMEELGITVKSPTKQTVLAAALYKKAQKGDLSALKEILGVVRGNPSDMGGVVLIDDIGNKA